MLKLKLQYFSHLDQLTGKDPDVGKDWGQEEKGETEDEMVGWHHWLVRHAFEETLGESEGQESLVCCSPWCCKEVAHDLVTEQHICPIVPFSLIDINMKSCYNEEECPVGYQFSSVQSVSHVWLFATRWTEAHQASLSITDSHSLLKLMSIESVMPSNYLILCHPFLLLPSIFPSIRVFSNDSVLRIRYPNYWSFSFSISPSNEYSGLISGGDIDLSKKMHL